VTALLAAGVGAVVGRRVADRERTLVGVCAGECGTDRHDHGVETVYAAADGLAVGERDRDGAEERGANRRHTERQP
jgi:hypothetical protein